MADAAFQPDWFSKPGDTLATLMARGDLPLAPLADRLDCDATVVRGILIGTHAIDAALATKLAAVVGGTPAFWQHRQATYDQALDRTAQALPSQEATAWVKNFPFKDMANFGWLERPTRNDAVRACLAYFGVSSPQEWEERYAHFKDSLFRSSRTFSSDVGPLSAWLRQGEIGASLMTCSAWNPDALKKRLGELRRLTRLKSPKAFVPELRRLCAEAGVAVVFVRAPAGCRASGAARFLSPRKAMIILSFRFLSDDQVWFTFFHEIGHLLLHGSSSTFIDGEASSTDQQEVQANSFAESMLIPASRREDLIGIRTQAKHIIRFAVSVGVCPGIVVGQLQHLGVIGRHQLNSLKRRYSWDEISASFV